MYAEEQGERLVGPVAVIGFGVTGEAVARLAIDSGVEVVAFDDVTTPERRDLASHYGLSLRTPVTAEERRSLLEVCELVVVSPGIPPSHWIYAVAPSDRVVSEIELASRFTRVPIVAITGTNGKTTVTTLVDQMLDASGLRSVAAGNIGTPLVDAAMRTDLDVIVAEVSSFQLAHTRSFRPRVATWLNLAEDHLDWHPTMQDYAASKAKIFASQGASDVAVVNHHDPVIVNAARAGSARVVTFGRHDADYVVAGERLVGPSGEELATIDLLPRALPHDLDNAIAAFATAIEAGGNPAGGRLALRSSTVLPHRIEFVAEIKGVRFYDDSKATTPSSVTAVLGAFERTVLIAGGKNKGLDLSPIAEFAQPGDRSSPGVRSSLRAVVAIGEAADELMAIFPPGFRVVRARSMDEAVVRAYELATSGDVVVLSPGCASFDWYRSYAERGRDFVRAVRVLLDKGSPTAGAGS